MDKALLQATITVSIAIIIYLFKSFLDELFFEAKKEYNKIRAQIATTLIFYADKYSNPSIYDDLSDEGQKSLKNAQKKLRKLASDLYGFSENIGTVRRTICRIPKKLDLNTTTKNLVGLSNGLTKSSREEKVVQSNLEKASIIKTLLKIQPLN